MFREVNAQLALYGYMVCNPAWKRKTFVVVCVVVFVVVVVIIIVIVNLIVNVNFIAIIMVFIVRIVIVVTKILEFRSDFIDVIDVLL